MCRSPTSGSPSLSCSELCVAQMINSIAHLPQCIARTLLLRYQQDVTRLYSTRLHNVALGYLQKLVQQCTALTGPGWIANNVDSIMLQLLWTWDRAQRVSLASQCSGRILQLDISWACSCKNILMLVFLTYQWLYHTMFPFVPNTVSPLRSSASNIVTLPAKDRFLNFKDNRFANG
jgi:hypothetical protein